jgi:ferritin-like metal-binding protein YciE
MKKIEDLKDLMTEQLRDLYQAEEVFDVFLPNLMDAINSVALLDLVDEYLRNNEDQIMRLRQVFDQILFVDDHGEICEAMKAMIKETNDIVNHCTNPSIRDAGIVTALQHVIHYKIAGYGAICSYATALNLLDVAGLIHQNLVEEKKIDAKLALLAEEVINELAIIEDET